MRISTLYLALLLFVTQLSFAKWDYPENKDRMTDDISSPAHLLSKNKVTLDFPYNKPQYGGLAIFRMPDDSLLVAFYVLDGQIACSYSAYDECQLRIRFDNEDAQKWPYRKPDVSKSTSIRFESSDGLIRKLKNANKVLIEVPFYGQSSEIFEFSVSGLDLMKIK